MSETKQSNLAFEKRNDLLWDDKRNIHMQYSPMSDRWLPVTISPWDIDKPEYQPQNLDNYNDVMGQKERAYNFQVRPTYLKNEYSLSIPNHNHADYANGGYINAPIPYKPQNSHQLHKYNTTFGNLVNFSKSDYMPNSTWAHLADNNRRIASNVYGKRVMQSIPDKSIHFKVDTNKENEAHIRGKSEITFNSYSPTAAAQAEELIHSGQKNYYGWLGIAKGIPGINYELEAKIIADLIHCSNFVNKDNGDVFTEIPFVPLGMSRVGYELPEDLYKEYMDIIDNIVLNRPISLARFIDIYKQIGANLDPEKSRDPRIFDPKILPYYLINIILNR
ncbi:MAG: hypothetical protein E7083_06790 [Bacteroidales bacterium]|nr:hypothetical protein [Bacteroidales bacterium]